MNVVDRRLCATSGLQPPSPRFVDLPQVDDFNALGNNPALWDPYRAPGSVQGGIASRQEFLGTFWPWFKAATLLLKVYERRTCVFIRKIVGIQSRRHGLCCLAYLCKTDLLRLVLPRLRLHACRGPKKRFRLGGAVLS